MAEKNFQLRLPSEKLSIGKLALHDKQEAQYYERHEKLLAFKTLNKPKNRENRILYPAIKSFIVVPRCGGGIDGKRHTSDS